MKYVICRNNIPIKYQKVYGITPNYKYKVLAINDRYNRKLLCPNTNPTEYEFDIRVVANDGYSVSIGNTFFKSTRELNLEKILNII